MFVALVLALLTSPAQAAPYTLAARLVQILPEGYREGVTAKGAPCRVVFGWTRGHSFDPSYARAQVIAEPEGNLVDVELYFNGYRGKTYGRWGQNQVSAHYRQSQLSVVRGPKGLLVKAVNKTQKASCYVTP